MSWAEVPAKLAIYRTMAYSNDEQADKLIAAFYGKRLTDNKGNYELSINYIPVSLQPDFEEALDYRMAACTNLANSVAWKPGKNYPT